MHNLWGGGVSDLPGQLGDWLTLCKDWEDINKKKKVTLLAGPWWMWRSRCTAGCGPVGWSSGSCCRSPYWTASRSGSLKSRWPVAESPQVVDDRHGAQQRTTSSGKFWTMWWGHFDLFLSWPTSGSWPWPAAWTQTQKDGVICLFYY